MLNLEKFNKEMVNKTNGEIVVIEYDDRTRMVEMKYLLKVLFPKVKQIVYDIQVGDKLSSHILKANRRGLYEEVHPIVVHRYHDMIGPEGGIRYVDKKWSFVNEVMVESPIVFDTSSPNK